MNTKNSIQKYEGNTTNVLQDSLAALFEGFSGIAASERKDFTLSIGHIIQSIFKGKFLEQLTNEWDHYRNTGKIKDDYQTTRQHIECLKEMLDFIDSDNPDQEQFDVMKRIFFRAALEDDSDRDSIIPQQFLRQTRRLSSGEIVILKTVYDIAQTDFQEMSAI